MVELILATDLGMQGALLAQWSERCALTPQEGGMDVAGLHQNSSSSSNSTITTNGGSSSTDAAAAATAAASDDRKLFLKMVLKAADVSNPAKPLPLYLYWTERILDEFYAQGDEEKALGLPVTAMPQCDRRLPAVSPGQKGFISFVVRPVFAALVSYSEQVLDAQFANQQQQQLSSSKSSAITDGTSDASSSSSSSSDNGNSNGNGVQNDSSNSHDAGPRTLPTDKRPWPGLTAPLEHLDANLAFWKECEASLPKEAWANVCVPSDLPLAELAPEAMAAEVAAMQAVLEADGGGKVDSNVSNHAGKGIAVEAAVGSEKSAHDDSSSSRGDSSSGNGDGDSGAQKSASVTTTFDGDSNATPTQPPKPEEEEETEIVKDLRSENEALAEKLRQAEELIAKLQPPSQEPPQEPSQELTTPSPQDEHAEQQNEQHSDAGPVEEGEIGSAGAAAIPAGADGNSEPSSEEVVGRVRSSSTVAAAEAQAAAHEVGARIRALQATIAAQDAHDPNASSRFLHQPRGHRLEPMVGVDNMMRPTGEAHAHAHATGMDTTGATVAHHAQDDNTGGGGAFASPVSRASMSQVHSTSNTKKTDGRSAAASSSSSMAFRATDGSMLASSKAAADAIRAASKGGSPP